MTLDQVIEEMERLRVLYGGTSRVLVHGPDASLEGGYGSGVRVQMVNRMYSVAKADSFILLQGQGNDDGPGRLEFKWSDAEQIVEGRALRGPDGDFPPGS